MNKFKEILWWIKEIVVDFIGPVLIVLMLIFSAAIFSSLASLILGE